MTHNTERDWKEQFKIEFKKATDDCGFPHAQVIRVRLESFIAQEIARAREEERNRVVDYIQDQSNGAILIHRNEFDILMKRARSHEKE